MSDIPAQATSLDSLEAGAVPAAADEQYVKQILAEMNQPLEAEAAPVAAMLAPTAAAAAPAAVAAPSYSPDVPAHAHAQAHAAAAPRVEPPHASMMHRVAAALAGPLLVALLVTLLSLPLVTSGFERAVPAALVGTLIGTAVVGLLRATTAASLFAAGSWLASALL